MSTMTTKSRLFIDLDGTVARFYDASPNYLEQMYEKGYFRNLQPEGQANIQRPVQNAKRTRRGRCEKACS